MFDSIAFKGQNKKYQIAELSFDKAALAAAKNYKWTEPPKKKSHRIENKTQNTIFKQMSMNVFIHINTCLRILQTNIIDFFLCVSENCSF